MSPDSSLSNASGAESLAIQPQKLLILDARSYAAAVANRAKGGGCECPGEVHSASVLVSAARAHLGLSYQLEMNGKPCSQPVLREPHLLGFAVLHALFMGEMEEGVQGNRILPSRCQPFGDEERQSSPLRRPVRSGSCCFGGLVS